MDVDQAIARSKSRSARASEDFLKRQALNRKPSQTSRSIDQSSSRGLADNRPSQRTVVERPLGYLPPGARSPAYRPPGFVPPKREDFPVLGGEYWMQHSDYRWQWGQHNLNWWAWAKAGDVAGWLNNRASSPTVYFDYGTNLYLEDGKVFYFGKPIGTPEEYVQQAQTIAKRVPAVDPAKVSWLPLGVFVITEKDGSAEDSNLFLQLAISKEGIIAGTFQNTATGKSFEIEGTIDPETQRAAWSPVGESRPIIETGIYNLTENEAGVLIHFEDEDTQQWRLFRVDQPQDGK